MFGVNFGQGCMANMQCTVELWAGLYGQHAVHGGILVPTERQAQEFT